MKKALSVTSPDNAMALAVYFVLGLAGLMYTLGVIESATLHRSVPSGVADIWSTTLMLSSWGALVSAMTAKKSQRPEINLKFEMFTSLGLGLNLGFFMWAILHSLGYSSWGSVTFALAFCGGGIWRSIQIFFELRKVRVARKNPELAGPVLADPQDEIG